MNIKNSWNYVVVNKELSPLKECSDIEKRMPYLCPGFPLRVGQPVTCALKVGEDRMERAVGETRTINVTIDPSEVTTAQVFILHKHKKGLTKIIYSLQQWKNMFTHWHVLYICSTYKHNIVSIVFLIRKLQREKKVTKVIMLTKYQVSKKEFNLNVWCFSIYTCTWSCTDVIIYIHVYTFYFILLRLKMQWKWSLIVWLLAWKWLPELWR